MIRNRRLRLAATTPEAPAYLPLEPGETKPMPAPPYGHFIGGRFVRHRGKIPAACECGAPWVVLFCGQDGQPSLRVTEEGITTIELPAIPEVADLALCLDCARARGWPDLRIGPKPKLDAGRSGG